MPLFLEQRSFKKHPFPTLQKIQNEEFIHSLFGPFNEETSSKTMPPHVSQKTVAEEHRKRVCRSSRGDMNDYNILIKIQ